MASRCRSVMVSHRELRRQARTVTVSSDRQHCVQMAADSCLMGWTSMAALCWLSQLLCLQIKQSTTAGTREQKEKGGLGCSPPAAALCGLARQRVHRAQPCLYHDNMDAYIHGPVASCSRLPLSSEARDGGYSPRLFSLQNLLLVPPGGRWSFSGHPGKPG